MNPKRIKTLEALHEERLNLKIRMAATRKELFRSATDTTSLGRQFLFQKVMSPVAAAGLGIAATRKVFAASGKGRAEQEEVASGGSGHWFLQLLLAGLPFLQQYLSQLHAEKKEAGHHSRQTRYAAAAMEEEETGIDWVETLLPIGVSLLRNFIQSKLEDDDPDFEEDIAFQSSES